MKTMIATRKSNARLNNGANILMKAQAVNMRPVKARFQAFAEAHGNYSGAHVKVDDAEKALLTQQALVAECAAKQGDTVHALAVSLVNNGQPLTNPFAAFGGVGPGKMKSLPPAEAIAEVGALVATLRRSQSVSQETLLAADHSEKAANDVAAALPALDTARETLRAARALRDTYGQTWDAELANLRLAVRSAEREVPGLFAALFGRSTSRSPKKTNGAAKASGQTPSSEAVNSPPPAPSSVADAPVA